MVRPLRQGPSQPSYPTAWPCSGAGTGLFIFRGQPGCPGLRPSTRRKTSRGVYVRRSFSTRSPRLFTTDSPGGKNRSCRTDRMVFPLALPLLPSKDQLHVVTTKGMQTKEYTTHNTHTTGVSVFIFVFVFVSRCFTISSRLVVFSAPGRRCLAPRRVSPNRRHFPPSVRRKTCPDVGLILG